MSNYVYVFIRKDLPIHQQLVQACHSALEAGSEFKQAGKIPNLILLQIPDSYSLSQTEEYLSKHGIRFHKFFEPDDDMGFTSITTEPLGINKKSLMRCFDLWKHES